MIRVVNMIPACMSGETNQDSEPFLTVDRANPDRMVATAFTLDPCHPVGGVSPVFVSTDGGDSWTLTSIIPIQFVGDQTVGFVPGGDLFAAALDFLESGDFVTRICRIADPMSGDLMEVIDSAAGLDQPFIQVRAVTVGGAPRAQVFVGGNEGSPGSRVATTVVGLDATGAAPDFVPVRLESRDTAQDSPSTRVALHPDGVAYGAYYHVTDEPGMPPSTFRADVVVVRDDAPGSGGPAFGDLIDAADGRAGVRVVRNMRGTLNDLGNERAGSELSLAVDPSDAAVVFVVYGDDVGSGHTLHLMKSRDSGASWTEIRAVANATNPAVAVNAWGDLGFIYQQLGGGRWRTVFDRIRHGGDESFVLSDFQDGVPGSQGDPYLGDFLHLLSIDTDFYGIFSAGNVPDMGNFPQSVHYQRSADFGAHTLDDGAGNAVAPSIDPFFFHWTPDLPGVSGISYAFDECGLPPEAGSVAGFWVYVRETTDPLTLRYHWSVEGAAPYGSTDERTVSVQLPPAAADGSSPPITLTVDVTVGFPGTEHPDVVIERTLRFTPQNVIQQRLGRWVCRYRQIVFPLPPWIFPRVGPDPYPRVTIGDAADAARAAIGKAAMRADSLARAVAGMFTARRQQGPE